MKQIVVKILANGTVNAETRNMKGYECQKYVHVIESIVKGVSVDSKYKDLFYENLGVSVNSEGLENIENSMHNMRL